MSQVDYTINSNEPIVNARTDIMAFAQAILTQNSGNTAPVVKYEGMFWADTTTNLLKQWHDPNWLIICELNKVGNLSVNAGNPNGAITGLYEGQILFDTSNNIPWYYSGSGTSWLNSFGFNNLSAFPVGSMTYWVTPTPPSGWLIRDGSAISRTAYVDLFNVLNPSGLFTSQTFTVTIASPCVVTKTAHGFINGERLRLSTTGALPTGLNTTTDYFVFYIDANTFGLCSDEMLTTRINTSGTQSGTHSYLQSLYGLGNGTTTFNVPDDRGVFLRGRDASKGYDTNRAFGTAQNDDFKSHTHGIGIIRNGANGSVRDIPVPSGSGGAISQVTEATGGTEPRPKNRAYLPIIKF